MTSAPADKEAAVFLLSSHGDVMMMMRRHLQVDNTLELVKNVFLILLSGIAIVLGMAVLAYFISLFVDKCLNDDNGASGGVGGDIMTNHPNNGTGTAAASSVVQRLVSWVFVPTNDGSFSSTF
jgi:hypothetical protein